MDDERINGVVHELIVFYGAYIQPRPLTGWMAKENQSHRPIGSASPVVQFFHVRVSSAVANTSIKRNISINFLFPGTSIREDSRFPSAAPTEVRCAYTRWGKKVLRLTSLGDQVGLKKLTNDAQIIVIGPASGIDYSCRATGLIFCCAQVFW